MTALTHGLDKSPCGRTTAAADTWVPGALGEGPAVLHSEKQRLFGLAERVADYGRKQWEELEPVLRRST